MTELLTYVCQRCSSSVDHRPVGPHPLSLPCYAATGPAGGRCGGRMVLPSHCRFTIACIRCNYIRQAATASELSVGTPCPWCGTRLT